MKIRLSICRNFPIQICLPFKAKDQLSKESKIQISMLQPGRIETTKVTNPPLFTSLDKLNNNCKAWAPHWAPRLLGTRCPDKCLPKVESCLNNTTAILYKPWIVLNNVGWAPQDRFKCKHNLQVSKLAVRLNSIRLSNRSNQRTYRPSSIQTNPPDLSAMVMTKVIRMIRMRRYLRWSRLWLLCVKSVMILKSGKFCNANSKQANSKNRSYPKNLKNRKKEEVRHNPQLFRIAG